MVDAASALLKVHCDSPWKFFSEFVFVIVQKKMDAAFAWVKDKVNSAIKHISECITNSLQRVRSFVISFLEKIRQLLLGIGTARLDNFSEKKLPLQKASELMEKQLCPGISRSIPEMNHLALELKRSLELVDCFTELLELEYDYERP